MRGLLRAAAVALALAAVPAPARRAAPAGFAEPADIIAAEGNFSHLLAAKGGKAAVRATAAANALIYAPGGMRAGDIPADIALPPQWHTGQIWMSCDGSIAVTHGHWRRSAAAGWYITVWRRQKGGDYKWLLVQGAAQPSARPETDMPATDMPEPDMIAASVADCPARRARTDAAADHRALPVPDPSPDPSSGHADDATLDWTSLAAADGARSFILRLKQGGAMHEVLRADAPAPGR